MTKLETFKNISTYQFIKMITMTLIVLVLFFFGILFYINIKSSVIFHDTSTLLSYTLRGSDYPQGYAPSQNEIDALETTFEHVSFTGLIDMSSSERQNIDFIAASGDFVKTGVPVYNYNYRKNIVQKIELVAGKLWEIGTKDPVIVIDETTAERVFSRTGVVGSKINTQYGELTIVGIVSDTYARNKQIEAAIKRGDLIDEDHYSTTAYIPVDFIKTVYARETVNFMTIEDSGYTADELKKEIIDMLNVEDYLLTNRADIISVEMQGFRSMVIISSLFCLVLLITAYAYMKKETILTSSNNFNSVDVFKDVRQVNK